MMAAYYPFLVMLALGLFGATLLFVSVEDQLKG